MTDEKGGIGTSPRSPAYPQYGLRRAIDMVRGVYEGAHRSEISNDAIVGLMGFNARSGPSSAAIAALKYFGLIEGRDPKLRVTPLALKILEPLNEQERKVALLTAAQTPAPFGELSKEFGPRRPAEGVLRSLAVRRYNLSGSGAAKFVSTYLDTVDFLASERVFDERDDRADEERTSESSFPAPERREGVHNSERPEASSRREEPKASSRDDLPSGERLELRLSPDSRALVVFSGVVTQESVAKLASLLMVMKDTFPSAAELDG